MPALSRFYGIVITMYVLDHGRPHFHARYVPSPIRVDPDLGTVAWPNGADLDPVVPYDQVTGAPFPGLAPPAGAGQTAT